MEKPTLTILQGLPASGKTTWAKEVVRKAQRLTKRVKKEILCNEIIPKDLSPILAIDDRDKVVDMWRSLGIQTLQINYGSF